MYYWTFIYLYHHMLYGYFNIGRVLLFVMIKVFAIKIYIINYYNLYSIGVRWFSITMWIRPTRDTTIKKKRDMCNTSHLLLNNTDYLILSCRLTNEGGE